MQRVVPEQRRQAGARQRISLFAPVFLLLLFSAASVLAAGGDIIWQAGDSQPGKQEARSSAVDRQGNMVVTGVQNLSGDANDDYWTVKFKADGSGVLWRASFDKSGGADQAVAVVIDAANDVIVTGFVSNGLNKDIHTIKYAGETGAVLWQQSFNGSAQGNDSATAISVDSLNNIYVSGYTQSSGGDDDGLLLKYAPSDGALAWQRSYAGAAGGNDQLLAVAAGAATVAVTGQTWNGSALDQVTILYDLTGQEIWNKRHGAPGGATANAAGKYVKIDAAGNVAVAGSAANSLDLDIYTVLYGAATGAILWDRTYNGAFDDEPSALWIDAAGDLYVTGYTWTLAGNNDFYTGKYKGGDGSVLWESGFDSGGGNTDAAIATGIVVDDQGDLFVTGYTVTSGNYDFQTIKYKKDTGTQLWQRTFNGAGLLNDRPAGIGLSPAGELLVAGWTDTGANNLDTYVIKYDPGVLNPPTELTATTLSNSSIQLSWLDNSATEDGFMVERKLGENGVYELAATVLPNSTSYTDSGLVGDTFYYYRVQSYNGTNGNSHYSNEAHALTVVAPVILPTGTYFYNSPDNLDDFIAGIAAGVDNHPVITGYSLRAIGGFDYYTLKLNRADSVPLWSHLYDDPDGELDKATCLAVDSANNVVVSGFSSLFSGAADKNINSIYTIKYPAAGPPQIWTAQYNGPGAIDDRATSIATTTDAASNTYVLGYGKNVANNEDIYLVKYDATGAKLWATAPFDGGGTDIPAALAVAPDDSIYVTGFSETGAGTGLNSFFTARYSSAGALIWSDRYSVQAGGESKGKAITVAADGSVYVTGTAVTASGSADIYTIRYQGGSASAVRLWERSYDGAAQGDDAAAAISVDPIDGAIVVAGTALTGSGNHDAVILRYTPAGATVWQRVYQRPANDDYLAAMAVDASGYIYLAGSTSNGPTMDMLAVLFDYEGTLLGLATYNGAANGNEEAAALAVNHLGEAFIAGYSENASGNADYLLFKLVNPYILTPSPFAVTAPPDSSLLNLSWQENGAGGSFRIERTIGPVTAESVWTLLGTLSPGTVTYQDSGLNQNSSYCYRIEAFDGTSTSRKAIACGTTTLAPPLLAPLTLLSATAIDISWPNVPASEGYQLERSVNGVGWSQIGGTLPSGTILYHDTTLASGTVYSYRLTALNSGGASLPGNVQSAPVFYAPAGITAAKIDLSWPAIAGAESYLIERSSDTITWAEIASPAGGAASYSDTTVASGETYYYRLKVITAGLTSGASLVKSAAALLKTPELTAATAASTSGINLLWSDPNTNETGHSIEYSQCTASFDNPLSCAAYLGNDSYWYGWTAVPAGADITATTVAGLTSGRSYRFRVKATRSGANSTTSNVLMATPDLAPPANLVATAATDSAVTLTWSDILGETNYKIEQGGVLLPTPLAKNSVTTTVTGLTANTEYCFRIQPYNDTSSAFSNQSCVTIYGAPTLSSVTADSSTQVTLAWTDVSGETGYEVWQSAATYPTIPPATPTSGYWNAYLNLTPAPLSAESTSYQKTGLTAGYAYKYKIRYKLPDGNFSAFSNEIMVVTTPLTPVLTATPLSPAQIRLNWVDGYGETNYNIQQKVRTGGDCTTEDWTGVTPFATTVNMTTTTRSALTENTVYCFRINASNGYGVSPWGTAITRATLLTAPTLNPLSGITQSKIDLSWNNIPANTGYRIERSLDNSVWTELALPAADATAWSDTTAAANQLYYYRVASRNSLGDYSLASNVHSATTLPVTPPVLGPFSGITPSQLTVNWGDVAENNGYKVERSLNNTLWTEIATPAAGALSYTDISLSAGTLYYYRVSTLNTAGSYSLPSTVLSTTTTPAAPVLALTPFSAARIDLSWQVVKGATHYRVLRSSGVAGPPWDEIVASHPVGYTTLYCGLYPLPSIGCPTLTPVATTLSDEGLTRDTTYCYQLMAWNASGGYSSESAAVCARTSPVNGPDLTTVTPLTAMKIQLEWSYSPAACTPDPCLDADGFEIWRQLLSGEWARIGKTGNVSTYVDSQGIEPLRTYRYRLRAYKGADVSAFSSDKEATTPVYTGEAATCP